MREGEAAPEADSLSWQRRDVAADGGAFGCSFRYGDVVVGAWCLVVGAW